MASRNKFIQMKIHVTLFLSTIALIIFGCQHKESDSSEFVLVEGGNSINPKSNLYNKSITVSDFIIGKYEVTQKSWVEIMNSNPSTFKGDNLPVETVSWYDCIVYCNKRSIKEGLTPFYTVDTTKIDAVNISEFDSLKWLVTMNENANGYRLPTEIEWEYAASGGKFSKGYIYSGSDFVNDVAWYWQNSGDTILAASWTWSILQENHNRPQPSGRKKPNELGLYDMSGNVREWCQDWYEDIETKPGLVRSQRGGGWMGAEYRCKHSDRHSFEASGKGPDQGFRICRNI